MAAVPQNPLSININAIYLRKFRGAEQINLIPQFYELNIYQSLFLQTMKAELLVYDPIGLFYNYPMVGEESVEIDYEPTGTMPKPKLKLTFMVNSVKLATPDPTAKTQIYILELYSTEMRENARLKLQRAYNDQYENIIRNILEKELLVDKEKYQNWDILSEKTTGKHHFMVPNMHPFEAIAWMTKRAVPENADTHLMFFFETFWGYNFRTYEEMMKGNRILGGVGGNPFRYTYVSDMTDGIRDYLKKSLQIPEAQIVNALQISRRWDTNEKIIGGYFENEYYDIDIYNRRVNVTKTTLPTQPTLKVYSDGMFSDKVYNYNTPSFVELVKTQNTTPGSTHRVRYATSIDEGDDVGEDNFFRVKWGEAARTETALSQLELRIAIEGDTRVNAGDIIEMVIPSVDGFTQKEDQDKFIQGVYLVTDLKHTISVGMRHATVLNINRTTLGDNVDMKMKYKVQ